MKIRTFVLLALPLTLSITGCVRSHRAAYYTPAPAVVTTPAVVAPTSDRTVERVYPTAPTTVLVPSTPPPAVVSSDVTVANSVSQLLKGDRSLAEATRNVEAFVSDGVVTLRGSVPTDHHRDEIVERISRLPGVASVRDQLGVELR